MAIPIPATRVPPYSGTTEAPAPRTRVPTPTRASAQDTAASRPTRRASAAPTGANSPMQTTGRAVSSPAPVADSPRSDWMVSSSGGTAAMAGRRFSATATTTTSSQPARTFSVLDIAPDPRDSAARPSNGHRRGCGGGCGSTGQVPLALWTRSFPEAADAVWSSRTGP